MRLDQNIDGQNAEAAEPRDSILALLEERRVFDQRARGGAQSSQRSP